MRPRLLLLVAPMVLLEGSLFTALGPLLPHLTEEFGLSTSEAGLLASAYVVGAILSTFFAAMGSTWLGVKMTVTAGLVVLAAMNLAFALAGSYSVLVGAQLVAGVGAGAMWVGAMTWLIDDTPNERRGEALGTAWGVAAVGEIAGPIIGGVAATVGRGPTFGAIAAAALLLVGLTLRVPAPSERAPTLAFRLALASRNVRDAAWLSAVPMVLLGALLVLGAFQLHHLGAGSSVIAAAFAVAAGAAAVQGPLVGRWSDRRGRLLPTRFGFLVGIPVLVALAVTSSTAAAVVLVVLAMVTVRFSAAPTVARLSDACQEAGVDTVVTLLIVLPVTAAGVAIGATGSGVLAGAVGISGAYVALAVLLLAALAWLQRQTDIPASADESVPVTELAQD